MVDRYKSFEGKQSPLRAPPSPEPETTQAGGERKRRRVRHGRPWWRRRRTRRLAVVFGVGILVLLAADAVLAARQAATSLETARSYLEQAADRLVEGRLSQAAFSFDRAREASGKATGALRRPGA